MGKYIIKWDSGYGENYMEVEADSLEEADKMAWEECRDEFESNASYGVVGESTEELREDYL